MSGHMHEHFSYRTKDGLPSIFYYPSVRAARTAVDKLGGGVVLRVDGTVVEEEQA